MIVLDTNVISEMMKVSPAVTVSSWLDQHDAAEIYITTVTIAEISYGINALSDGSRKKSLQDAFNQIVKMAFKHRVLQFDESAAQAYGKLMGHRKLLGKPMSILDGQIAAIVRANEAALATRNIRDFQDCDIDLINPFL